MSESVSFDRVAGVYDATRGFPPEVGESIADAIVEATGATPDTSFLEPGIGTGRVALPLVRRGYPYTGVDISEQMMAELRRKLAGAPHRLGLVSADVTELPFEDASFDVALTVHVLHLVPGWRAALGELRRVLRPGGVYLHCRDRREPGSARDELNERWREILERLGVELSTRGAREGEVVATLREQGARLETFTAGRWSDGLSVGELLRRQASRSYSSSWQVPDDAHEAAMRELTAWALERYGSEEASVASEAVFDVTVARGWAGGRT
jgi:ubiquinone/menaquinone biosynthesis C-methylase UbiE